MRRSTEVIGKCGAFLAEPLTPNALIQNSVAKPPRSGPTSIAEILSTAPDRLRETLADALSMGQDVKGLHQLVRISLSTARGPLKTERAVCANAGLYYIRQASCVFDLYYGGRTRRNTNVVSDTARQSLYTEHVPS